MTLEQVSADILALEEELLCIKTTIRTFLHDLDDVPCDDSKPGVLMSPFMWMQVEAFRRLVAR